MYHFPIGILLDSLKMDTRPALEKAAQLGVKGLQLYATIGAYSPERMNAAARRELLDMVKSNGLVFSALCGDLGKGFGSREKNPALLERSKRILDLAKELETNVVTTHIGVVPADPAHERYQIMQEACFELSGYADSLGAHFAIETGPEAPEVLKGFLDGLHSKGVAVNYDPANLVMVIGSDAAKGVHVLKDYIVHTHAKDGKQLFYKDPEMIYGVTEEVIITGDSFLEVPLGAGDVHFDSYLAALDEIGYRGFLTIERECGDNPVADIEMAVRFLNDSIEKEK